MTTEAAAVTSPAVNLVLGFRISDVPLAAFPQEMVLEQQNHEKRKYNKLMETDAERSSVATSAAKAAATTTSKPRPAILLRHKPKQLLGHLLDIDQTGLPSASNHVWTMAVW